MNQENKRRPAEGPRIAVAQIAPLLGDVEANLDRHRAAIDQAREAGVDVLVFPELSLTGYRLKDTVPEVAATDGDDVFERLALMSADISLLVGLVEETQLHHFFNTAAYFQDGKLAAVHRKVYLPTYGMFDEQRYFARGNRIRAFDTRHGRAATLICEDMLHPSAMTIAALDGAGVIFVPSASPVRGVSGEDEAETGVDANGRHWEGYLRAMARTLGCYVVYANRTGVEDGQTYWGGSEIVGPDGAVIAKAAYYEDDFISAVLPDGAIRRRRIQAPVLRDEDVDLTINELLRIRERPRTDEDRDKGRQRPEGDRDGRRQQRHEGGRSEGGRSEGGRNEGDRSGRGRGGRNGQGRGRGRRDDRRGGGGGGGGGGGQGRDRRFAGNRRDDRRPYDAPPARQRPDPNERRQRPIAAEDNEEESS